MQKSLDGFTRFLEFLWFERNLIRQYNKKKLRLWSKNDDDLKVYEMKQIDV